MSSPGPPCSSWVPATLSTVSFPGPAKTTSCSPATDPPRRILLHCRNDVVARVQYISRDGVSKDFPASFLWKHNNVTLIVDRDAYALAEAEEE